MGNKVSPSPLAEFLENLRTSQILKGTPSGLTGLAFCRKGGRCHAPKLVVLEAKHAQEQLEGSPFCQRRMTEMTSHKIPTRSSPWAQACIGKGRSAREIAMAGVGIVVFYNQDQSGKAKMKVQRSTVSTRLTSRIFPPSCLRPCRSNVAQVRCTFGRTCHIYLSEIQLDL
jgi:hypothetical protein